MRRSCCVPCRKRLNKKHHTSNKLRISWDQMRLQNSSTTYMEHPSKVCGDCKIHCKSTYSWISITTNGHIIFLVTSDIICKFSLRFMKENRHKYGCWDRYIVVLVHVRPFSSLFPVILFNWWFSDFRSEFAVNHSSLTQSVCRYTCILYAVLCFIKLFRFLYLRYTQ